MRLRSALAPIGAGLLILAGCDAGAFVGVTESEPIAVNVSVDLSSAQASGVTVEVTGPGIPEPIIANLSVNGDSAAGQVRVLAGSDRAFLVRAFDAGGLETHQGADTVDITGSVTHSLQVPLTPLVGDVDVDARLGEYTVTVSVPTGTLAVGQTAQAQVVVVDTYGDAVQDPAVRWASLNPAVARVGDHGLIEALVPGQTTIAASYQGFGGSAAVVVQ